MSISWSVCKWQAFFSLPNLLLLNIFYLQYSGGGERISWSVSKWQDFLPLLIFAKKAKNLLNLLLLNFFFASYQGDWFLGHSCPVLLKWPRMKGKYSSWLLGTESPLLVCHSWTVTEWNFLKQSHPINLSSVPSHPVHLLSNSNLAHACFLLGGGGDNTEAVGAG